MAEGPKENPPRAKDPAEEPEPFNGIMGHAFENIKEAKSKNKEENKPGTLDTKAHGSKRIKGTLHPKKGFQMPDTSRVFNASEMRKESNRLIDGLKKKLYKQGVAPSDVSGGWQEARLAHDRITMALSRYNSVKDPNERAQLEQEVRVQVANLKGDVTDGVTEKMQDVVVGLPRQSGRFGRSERRSMKLEDKLGNSFEKTVRAERGAFLDEKQRQIDEQQRQEQIQADEQRRQERIVELRHDISTLEEAARVEGGRLASSIEPEILRLEVELHVAEGGELVVSAPAVRPVVTQEKGVPVAAAKPSIEETLEPRVDSGEIKQDSINGDKEIPPKEQRDHLSNLIREISATGGTGGDTFNTLDNTPLRANFDPEDFTARVEGYQPQKTEEGSKGPKIYDSSAWTGRTGKGDSTGGAPKNPEESPKGDPKVEEKTSESSDPKRGALLTAEKELIEDEKEFYAKHGAIGRAFRRMTGADGGKRAGLEEKVNRASAEYEQSLEQKLADRLSKKDYATILEHKKEIAGLKNEKVTSPEVFKDKVAERYRRSVISKDVIDRGEQARAAARQETLSAKEESRVSKGLRWFGERNAALEEKLGKNGARAVRVLLSASAGTLAVAAFGPVSATLFATRLARGVIGTFGGAAAGAGAGALYEKTSGARAARNLAEARTTVASTHEDIAAKRAAYRAGSAESIATQRKRVEMLTAFLSGAGLSLATAYSMAGIEATHTAISQAGVQGPDNFKLPPQDDLSKFNNSLMGDGHTAIDLSRQGLPSAHDTIIVHPPETPGAGGAPAVPENAPSMPSVEAHVGRGYEYMTKRLWEQMHDPAKPFTLPPNTDHNSDLYKLFNADKASIDKVVSDLASSDKGHDFFHVDGPLAGRSVLIGEHAHMTFGKDGNLSFSADEHAQPIEQAPSDAHTTAALQAVRAKLGIDHPRLPTAEQAAALKQMQTEASQYAATHPVETPQKTPVGTPAMHDAQNIPTRPPIPGAENAPAPQDISHVGAQDSHYHTGAAATASEAPPVISNPEATTQPSTAFIEHTQPFVNANKLAIDPTRGHIFEDSTHTSVAYAADFDKRFSVAQEYVQANHKASVWVQAKDPIFYNGAWRPWVFEVKYKFLSGVQANIPAEPDPAQIGGINPDTFIKQLDTKS